MAAGHPSGLAVAAGWLARIALVVTFAVSPMVLSRVGLNYDSPGGSAIEKIHPGTYLFVAAFGLLALAAGNPFAFVGRLLARFPLAAAFLGTWFALLFYILLFQPVPFTPIIDTFILPLLALWVIAALPEREHRVMALILHGLMAVNAVLGLAEVTTGWRLTPYVVGGLELTEDWRATALLGHPLANASVVCIYALALGSGGGRDLPPLTVLPLLLLQVLSMAAFGGRAALVIMLAGLALLALLKLMRVLMGAPVAPARVALAVLLAPVMALAALGLLQSGFLDRLIERFIDDRGSAETRIAMFNLFDEIPLQDVLLGPDPQLIAALKALEGLEFGIESFWVGFVLTYGAGIATVFFIGLAAFFVELLRMARASGWLLAGSFLVIISTSVSIAAKSTQLGLFTLLVLVLVGRLRRYGHDRETRASVAGTQLPAGQPA
jgi:hypothetical protein